jgi:WD40 repeat protein
VDFRQATRLAPNDAEAYAERSAVYYIHKRDHDHGLTDFDTAIRPDQNNKKAHFWLDGIYKDHGTIPVLALFFAVIAQGWFDPARAEKPSALKAELVPTVGHTGFIDAVAFSPDGRTLASSGRNDRTIKLWDADTGWLLRTLHGHSEGVSSVIFSRDWQVLASGSADHSIKLWQASTGRVLQTLRAHAEGVYCLIISPNGRILASGGGDNAIKLWDLASGRLIRTLTGHSNIANSLVFFADGQTLISGSEDKTIKLWDTATGRLVRTSKVISVRGAELRQSTPLRMVEL